MRRAYFIITIVIFIFPSMCIYAEKAKLESLKLLIEEALENNPKIKAAFNDWKAAEYKIKSVQGLPDPQASYSYFGKNVETRVGPQKSKYGISQKIPFPGKLSLKAKSQGKHAAILREQYEAIRREVIKSVKFLYYDIFWVDKAIQITDEEKAILESLEKVAQKKYESNLVPQQDVIKAQVEISKLIDKLFKFRQNRESLVARVNSLLDRPKNTPLGRVDDVEVGSLEYSLEQLHKIARDTRQELLAAQLSTEKAEYEKSLAKLDYFPDFALEFNYIQIDKGHTTHPSDGEDAWAGTIKVSLPIWFEKLEAGLKEKEFSLKANRKNFEDVENIVTYEIEDIYFKISTYKDVVLLYRTALVPQATQAFEAARTSYEAGVVDFLNLLDAERLLLQTRLAYYKSIVDYQKSIAYLERVVGRDL